MSSRTFAACGFCIVFAVYANAYAAITAFWLPVTITPQAVANDPALANMQCWDLMTTTTGDWNLALMRVLLPEGLTFYKHAQGGLTRPDPALFNMFPAIEFTTYVSSPSDDGTNNGTVVLGGHPQGHPTSLGDSTSPTPGEFSMAWGNLTVDLTGTYEIARLTFPQGGIPDVINNLGLPAFDSQTSQITPDSMTQIPDIPEPGMLGFVSALGLLGLRRRIDDVGIRC